MASINPHGRQIEDAAAAPLFHLRDTRENRLKYLPLIAETIYFHGLNDMELSDMETIARDVAGIQHAVMRAAM